MADDNQTGKKKKKDDGLYIKLTTQNVIIGLLMLAIAPMLFAIFAAGLFAAKAIEKSITNRRENESYRELFNKERETLQNQIKQLQEQVKELLAARQQGNGPNVTPPQTPPGATPTPDPSNDQDKGQGQGQGQGMPPPTNPEREDTPETSVASSIVESRDGIGTEEDASVSSDLTTDSFSEGDNNEDEEEEDEAEIQSETNEEEVSEEVTKGIEDESLPDLAAVDSDEEESVGESIEFSEEEQLEEENTKGVEDESLPDLAAVDSDEEESVNEDIDPTIAQTEEVDSIIGSEISFDNASDVDMPEEIVAENEQVAEEKEESVTQSFEDRQEAAEEKEESVTESFEDRQEAAEEKEESVTQSFEDRQEVAEAKEEKATEISENKQEAAELKNDARDFSIASSFDESEADKGLSNEFDNISETSSVELSGEQFVPETDSLAYSASDTESIADSLATSNFADDSEKENQVAATNSQESIRSEDESSLNQSEMQDSYVFNESIDGIPSESIDSTSNEKNNGIPNEISISSDDRSENSSIASDLDNLGDSKTQEKGMEGTRQESSATLSTFASTVTNESVLGASQNGGKVIPISGKTPDFGSPDFLVAMSTATKTAKAQEAMVLGKSPAMVKESNKRRSSVNNKSETREAKRSKPSM
ncbi:hypothetical protein [Ascidiimonas sp. W6]|uniref:hypothetical protein n=1 Tax=Ascidiimonas meishanensis TaxID=3128903 RepID=UPI0030EDB111